MKTRFILLGFMCSTVIPMAQAANVGISIDWPKELTVSCEPATPGRIPGRTDIVVSVTGLEIGKAYDVKLEGYYTGARHVSPRRSHDPSFLYKDVRPGLYEIRVRDGGRNRAIIATKSIQITAPEPALSAPATIGPNNPIKVSLSDAVGPYKRGWLYLTLVPAHYPLNERGPGRNNIKESCDVVQHEFKGLPAGRYEFRLFQSSAGDDPLLAKKLILVGNAGTPEQDLDTRRADFLQQLEQAKQQLEQLQAQIAQQQTQRGVGTDVTPVRTTVVSSTAEAQTKIAWYQAQFEDGRYLTEPDPPLWLDGQCVAWAKRLFDVGSSVPISGVQVGTAAKIPSVLRARGFEISTNEERPVVGALIVWDDGGAGHVGVVTDVAKDSVSQKVLAITVSDSNFGRVTAAGAALWGIDLEVAKREIITEEYGVFRERRFEIGNLNRGSYRFSAYAYPR